MKRILLCAILFGVGCTRAITVDKGTTTPGVTSVSEVTSETVMPAITVAPGATPLDTPALVATPTLAPIPSSRFSPTEIKYRLIAQFGAPFFCDRDVYPVARAVTDQELDQRFADIEQNPELFQAILAHNGLGEVVSFSQSQKLVVYNESKKLDSILLEPAGDKYQFSLRIGSGKADGLAIEGAVDQNGNVTVSKRQSAFLTCPICLALNTLIDTPDGSIPVQDLQRGRPIWTLDSTGARRAAVVTDTIRRPASVDFVIVHLVLEDGRELLVSAPHPTADGRAIGMLRVGDLLDGAQVLIAEKVSYHDHATYDVLPSGETGLYWANGILLKSTLQASR